MCQISLRSQCTMHIPMNSIMIHMHMNTYRYILYYTTVEILFHDHMHQRIMDVYFKVIMTWLLVE